MKRLLVPIVVLAVVLAACGGGKKAAAPKPTTTTSAPGPTTPPPAGNGGAPLTGLPGADPAALGRPVLMAKIDNAPNGRPQAGINQADVVVEEGVEGGITRLAVLFHSQPLPGTIGPVRSARTTDILIATPLNRPLFAWSGSNGDFVKLVRQAPLVDVGVDVKGGAYRREPKRPNPYNLFADPAKLYEGVTGGPPPSMFTYRGAGEASTGDPAAKAHMVWKDKVMTQVDWEWAADVGAWKRVQNGTPHVDAAGAQVLAKNVVIQLVTYHDTGYRDRSNTMVPEADLVGEGEAWLLSDGKIVRGHWKKGSAAEMTSFTDAAGAPFKLTPGQTWLELPKPGTASVA
jgi:hypothetical protein